MVKDFTNVTNILGKHLNQLSRANLETFIGELCRLEAPKGCNQIQIQRLEGKEAMEVAEMIMKSYTIRHGPTKVIQALKNINENQIRVKLMKELRGDPQRGGRKGNVGNQKPNAEAGESSKTSKTQQPGEDTKPKTDRQLEAEADSTAKSAVKAQATGGAAGRKRTRKERNTQEVKPKRKQPTRDKKHFVIENRNNLIKLTTHVDPVLDDLLDEDLLTQEQYDIIRKKSTNQDKMRELYDYVRSWGPKDNDKFVDILKKHNPVPLRNLLEKAKQKK